MDCIWIFQNKTLDSHKISEATSLAMFLLPTIGLQFYLLKALPVFCKGWLCALGMQMSLSSLLGGRSIYC